MTTQTDAIPGATPLKKKRISRFDSPWLNPHFIAGAIMIALVILAGILGPLVWDTKLSLVASSPLNLPPMWVQDEGGASQVAAAPTSAAATPTAGSLTATQTTDSPATPTPRSLFGPGGLGGSGIISLMATQTAAAAAPATPTPRGLFGPGGLGGSGIISLMATQTQAALTQTPQAGATPTPAPGAAVAQPTYQRPNQPRGVPEHPLGTDNSGRDILAVLIVGAPASLRVGVIAASVGMLIGVMLGFASGFLGGWVDNVIRTISDVAFTIPSLAVLLVISAYMRRVELDTMALLLALFAWPGPTRLIRAQVLTLRERGYVRMAQLSGLSTFDIMFKEMLPNLLPYLAASFAGNVSGAILAATSLEALGLGPTRYPTLGTSLFHALRATAIMRGMWWWWGFPLLTLVFIFTGLFQIATGLDEIANPRLRGVHAQ